MKKSAIPLALAVTAVGAAHEPLYVTEYYDECSTLPTTTIIDTVIHNYTPHAGVLTTYTTVYSQICSTGFEPKTFTVTEPCTEPGQDRAPTHIPQGFVKTTVTCNVCAETPVVAVITTPVPVPRAPGSGKTPAPAPAAPTSAGVNPAGNPPAAGGSPPPAGVPPAAGSTAGPDGALPPPVGAAPADSGVVVPPPAGAGAGGPSSPAPASPLDGGASSPPGGAVPPAGANPGSPAGSPASGGSVPGGSVPPAGVNPPPAIGGTGAPIPKTIPGSNLPADSGIVPFTGMASHLSIGISFTLGLVGVMSAAVLFIL